MAASDNANCKTKINNVTRKMPGVTSTLSVTLKNAGLAFTKASLDALTTGRKSAVSGVVFYFDVDSNNNIVDLIAAPYSEDSSKNRTFVKISDSSSKDYQTSDVPPCPNNCVGNLP